VSFFEPVFGQFIVGNVAGKLILGLGFSPFLLAFMVLHKRSLKQFIKKPFSTRLVILPNRKQLIEKLQMTEENLRKTEKKYEKAFNRATFYKDLFTHDIKNIFNNISMAYYLIDKERKTQVKLDYESPESLFNSINNQLNRGKSLISNIQKLSELDKEKIDLNRTDLLDYLLKTIEYIKKSNPRKIIEINVEKGEDQIFVTANELIADVFENILVNGIRYNENKVPEINITVSKLKLNGVGYVKLEFKDNGIGVQDSRKEKIFLEGYMDLKGEKGMGVGLSLITKIIKFFNGKIWVEDRIEGNYLEGSNFIVLIPEFNESNEK
jgi:signal transduction histidine kinase